MDEKNLFIKYYFASVLSIKAKSLNKTKYFLSAIRRGSNRINSQGDLTISLKPIEAFFHQNDLKDVSAKDFLQDCQENLPLIARTEFVNGICRVFLNRIIILSSTLPLVTDCNSDFWMRLKNLCGINVNILVEDQNNQSVTQLRCNLIANHLKNIFELTGATVHYLPLADKKGKCPLEETSSKSETEIMTDKCLRKKLKPEENKYNYVVTTNCHSNKNNLSNRILCSQISDKTENSKLHLHFNDYIKQLENELYEASKHKYGEMDETPRRNDYFNMQAKSCLTLHFMSVSHLSPIKVEIDRNTQNSRGSAFILYNHARLCMLFANLQTLIDEGYLPQLPAVEDVDFSLLKHPEEWELFWLYIHKYPELIKELTEEIIEKSIPSQSKITSDIETNEVKVPYAVHLNIESNEDTSDFVEPPENKINSQLLPKQKLSHNHFPTHNLTKFLHSLAHCLSVYYNRVHILPARPSTHHGPVQKLPPHLIPVLWARVYLLKSVKIVMQSCFESLDIVPPSTM